ncbi:Hpt domain-containing protein [Roseicyclus sediminis]|uniref:Hpt domain-containing protein n=1 Tax=Roseicyclus sediminis TaxID=2980997 RepID=UPI0021D360DA|nr:Hpt domain-containing protein [Roseibacterium sp. SDUM158016]
MQAGLADLRTGFLDRVADRCLEIEGIMAAAEGDELTTSERETVALHAHKTAGVAATFGFSRLGERALDVERLMTQTGDAPSWEVVRPVIEALLDEMERVLDETA